MRRYQYTDSADVLSSWLLKLYNLPHTTDCKPIVVIWTLSQLGVNENEKTLAESVSWGCEQKPSSVTNVSDFADYL